MNSHATVKNIARRVELVAEAHQLPTVKSGTIERM